ncbi:MULTISPECIES: TenA family protein [unclassified Luteimonas]|uniref:TenA family protein n=1 Tax=unclassified Luteimonas TaxID=2629088 RepID=UPI0018F0E8DF|nr:MULTISPECIES: TenA family protein [unclassified Luteimonas]MBJ6979842.1 TenA family protein [Luteimonas sp. MC1895]MBJ6985466.1 TenA family protein [Luteimonas sp. MC1750]QQO06045.1 TenA family protein [Luteimonas sp. MC1750]
MSLFERLKSAAADDWNAYVDHAFVRGLGDGRLPQAAFRNYLVQDYLFLIQFARAHALAAYKSRTLADMQAARGGLAAILDEMGLHLRVCERWGLSAADVEATAEQQATVAYTRYVLDVGMSGDLLDLQVALIPCTLGYAEIGRRLVPDGIEAIPADHPYRDWIAEYAGDAFQQAGAAGQAWLDDLARRYASEARFPELVGIFRTASRLEADFWQQGLDAAG